MPQIQPEIPFSVYIENQSGGVVNLNQQRKPNPQEVVGANRSVRWSDNEWDDFDARARAQGLERGPLIREFADLANFYSVSEAKQLKDDRQLIRFFLQNRALFIQLINVIRKA